MSKVRKRKREIYDRARYETIRVDGKVLEAVYRMQEAQSRKICEFEDCVLGHHILPLMTYVRVYYPEEDLVEVFHMACFGKEFGVHARY